MNKPAATLAKSLVRAPYAWPGGYPMYAVTDDGAALCKTCCKTEFRSIASSFPGDGWTVTALDVNWEDSDLRCDHCSDLIEAAYS